MVPPVLVGLAVVSEHLAVLVALPVSFYLHDGRLRRHAKRSRTKHIKFSLHIYPNLDSSTQNPARPSSRHGLRATARPKRGERGGAGLKDGFIFSRILNSFTTITVCAYSFFFTLPNCLVSTL